MPRDPLAPKKPLPGWAEWAFILLFCVTAVLEWHRGQACWAIGFAAAAVIFAATALLRALTRRRD